MVRAKLPNVEITGRSESCGKGNCQFMTLYAIQTVLPPKPVVKHLKFKVGYLTVILRRSFIFWNAEYVVKFLMLVRQKQNLDQDLIIIKVHTGSIEKELKYDSSFHEHYGQHSHNGTDNWQFTLIEQCEIHEQLKERETFWQHWLKMFCPYELNEKKGFLY